MPKELKMSCQIFSSFLDKSLLVAHNAEFDMAFLKHAIAYRTGYQIE